MADNVTITPGTGAIVATDDVGGVQYQRIKLDIGGDGVSVPVVTALPVTITNPATGVATETTLGAILAAFGAGIALDTATLAALETISVGNFPATQSVSGTVTATGPLTDTQLRAAAVAVSQPDLAGTLLTATPTLDTSAYASGDCLHTAVIEFANAASVNGGSGFIEKMVVVDNLVQSAAGELWLFSATVTPAAANAAHSISDADAAKCIGVIPFGPYYASALNSVSTAKGLNFAYKCAATSLFGILVTRGTPTYAATSLTVSLLVSRN